MHNPPPELVKLLEGVRLRLALQARLCPFCRTELVQYSGQPSDEPAVQTVKAFGCPTLGCKFLFYREQQKVAM